MKTITPAPCRAINNAVAVKVVVPAALLPQVNKQVTTFFAEEESHYNTLREQGWKTPSEIAENILGMSRDQMSVIRGLVEDVLGGTHYIQAPKNIGTKSHIGGGDSTDKFTPTRNIGGTLIRPDSKAWADVELYALKLQAQNMKKVVRALRAALR